MLERLAMSAVRVSSRDSRGRFTGRAVLLLILVASPAAALADEDEADLVKSAIREFYGQLALGDHKAAFGKFMAGASGYLPTGVLKELPNQESLEQAVRAYDERYKQGGRILRSPQYIQVSLHGNVALTTLLTEGLIVRPGNDRSVETVERVSFVWMKENGTWKIAHFHISNMNSDDP